MNRKRYIVFDVETPNHANDRMCSIGIVVVENQKIVKDQYFLINPEAEFDAINISLHGIKPNDVEDKPTFGQLWKTIEPVLSDGLLVAHNAPFDMSVLAKCLNAYDIEWNPYVFYACTCQMGRTFFPDAENYRLNTLCEMLNISLSNHHNALDDAKACANILLHCLEKSVDINNFIRNYDITHVGTIRTKQMRPASKSTSQLLALKEALQTVLRDGILTFDEISWLQEWMDDNLELRGVFPFDKIYEVVQTATIDGVLSQTERTLLFELFSQITNPLQNVCCCEGFDIEGKNFCLTGEFEAGTRDEVQALLITKGGKAQKNVTKKTDYLIVGKKGSEQWSAGNYGNKVKKAMEFQENGSCIKIVREDDIMLMSFISEKNI